MYRLSAEYYDAIYLAQKDYAREANLLKQVVRTYLHNGGNHLLDIACGTGLHLSHLKDDFQVEGMDISPDMIDIARRRLPDHPLYVGDMVDFSLPAAFDVILCMFGSIAYTCSFERLEKALCCMERHLKPGGILLIEPWLSPELYKPHSIHMQVVDQPDLKVVRMSTGQQKDRHAVLDMHHLVGTPKETVHFVEHHELALFDVDDLLKAFQSIPLLVHFDPNAVTGRGLIIAQKSEENR